MFKMISVVSVVGAMMFSGAQSSAWATQVAGKEQMKMQKQIEKKLTADSDLKNNRIGVMVDNSVVTLKGTVDTPAEKGKAEELAHVDGIVRVDNQLDVGSKGVGAAVTDTVITTKLKAEMVGDDELKHSDISVTTNNGVVMLTGTVASEAAREHAMAVAQKADGVKTVSNKLRVTAGK
ncbi:MAG TPA: BON domain-containing protein [Polyangia bacterium]|jgi:hyperosmotically inducible protein